MLKNQMCPFIQKNCDSKCVFRFNEECLLKLTARALYDKALTTKN